MDRETLVERIHAAFSGVSLGSGVSLRQAAVIDDYGGDMSMEEFYALPKSEVTDDWTSIPERELLRDNFSHLDAEGVRFYIPAIMVWLLDHYDAALDSLHPGAMASISAVSLLAPEADLFTFHMFDALTDEQRTVTASYLEALPSLVHLDPEDRESIKRSVREYWSKFLQA